MGFNWHARKTETGVVIRWYMDLVIAGNVVIGRTHQLPPPDETPKFGPCPPANWQAYGMLHDWQDTNLGNDHATQKDARKKIEEWYESVKQQEETTATIAGVLVTTGKYQGSGKRQGDTTIQLKFSNGAVRFFQPEDGKEVK